MARIALLSSAEKVFSELGLEHAKVEDIARAAGLSKGAFYLHFESKDAAFRQVVETFLARVTGAMEGQDCSPPCGAGTKTDHRALLQYWFDRDVEIFEYFWANRRLVRMVEACSGSVVYMLKAFQQAHAERVTALFRDLQAAGSFRTDFDAQFGALLMLGGYREFTSLIVNSEHKPDLRKFALEAQQTYVRAFAVPAVLRASQSFMNDHAVIESTHHVVTA